MIGEFANIAARGDLDTDIVIIGGGAAGIAMARSLAA